MNYTNATKNITGDIWRSPIGNTVDLKFDLFASLAEREVFGLRCQITPIDWDRPCYSRWSCKYHPTKLDWRSIVGVASPLANRSPEPISHESLTHNS